MKVSFKYDNSSNCILITPDSFKFTQLRGLNSYIKLVKGSITSELISVPLNDVDITDIYKKLRRIFEEEFDCQIEENLDVKNVFDEAEAEEQRFRTFSSRAFDIRNNNISEDEFKNFCEILGDTDFKRSLKTYQLLAAYHIAFSQNACNFSVPGSGKTSTVLAAFEYLRKQKVSEKHVDKLVVIGPLSAFIAWKLEFLACFGYEANTLEIRGGVSKKIINDTIMISNSDIELLIISYGSVQSNYEAISFFLKNNDCMVVLDEAHRIKKVSEDAQSNYVLSLSPLAKSRVILTGTPAANSYVDLYNLYKFIWPSNNIIGYSIAQLSAMSKNLNDPRKEDLMNRISPFFIRVKKSDLGLPEAVFRRPEKVEMSDIQRKIYSTIEKVVVNRFETGGLPESIRRAAAIRLRQAASNPALLLKSLEEDYVDYEADSVNTFTDDDIELDEGLINQIIRYKQLEVPNKFICARDIIKGILKKKEKVIIWCEFIGTCEDLSSYLEEYGINNRILYGKCKQEEREIIIEEFLNPENTKFNVIVANPHAVGESISLHTACHNAIYLEQGFNAGVYMQSKDRIHRVGLKDTDITTYYFIHSADSVDDVVYNRVLEKENRMLEIIESQEIPLLSNIDYEDNSEADIKAIIRDYYERRKRTI